jgi:serine/threonine-protein kinase
MNNLLKFPVYLFAFIFIGLVFGFLTFKILSFSRTVEVPSLSGKNLIEANELLTGKGLHLKIGGEDYDASIPPGYIIRQDTPAGNSVKEKRSIKVVISKGPRVFSVPLLVGETLSNAEYILMQKGLKITRVIRVHSDTIAKDIIISQKPEPDDRTSDSMTVLVSLGPHEVIYYCPDFREMSPDQSREIAGKLSLKIEVAGTGSLVKTQKPLPGAPMKKGETVFLKLAEEQ